MGVSQSALSHTIRQLEARLGIRLFTRTTRAVAPTEAGQRLLAGIAPHFDQIEVELDELSHCREKPAGTIRISASSYAINQILWPKIRDFLPQFPDINIELHLDNGLIDIVSQRFDAGVRLGEQIAKDMIAVRISSDVRFAAVATPHYFDQNCPPQQPQDLMTHNCINLRLPTAGGLYAWEFEKNGREIKIRVEGQLVFSDIYHIRQAALAGCGLAYLPEDVVLNHINRGELVRVLENWCPRWDGHYLYYPNRRQASPAFTKLVEHLRYRKQ